MQQLFLCYEIKTAEKHLSFFLKKKKILGNAGMNTPYERFLAYRPAYECGRDFNMNIGGASECGRGSWGFRRWAELINMGGAYHDFEIDAKLNAIVPDVDIVNSDTTEESWDLRDGDTKWRRITYCNQRTGIQL
jgi:hypothetical protein